MHAMMDEEMEDDEDDVIQTGESEMDLEEAAASSASQQPPQTEMCKNKGNDIDVYKPLRHSNHIL